MSDTNIAGQKSDEGTQAATEASLTVFVILLPIVAVILFAVLIAIIYKDKFSSSSSSINHNGKDGNGTVTSNASALTAVTRVDAQSFSDPLLDKDTVKVSEVAPKKPKIRKEKKVAVSPVALLNTEQESEPLQRQESFGSLLKRPRVYRLPKGRPQPQGSEAIPPPKSPLTFSKIPSARRATSESHTLGGNPRPVHNSRNLSGQPLRKLSSPPAVFSERHTPLGKSSSLRDDNNVARGRMKPRPGPGECEVTIEQDPNQGNRTPKFSQTYYSDSLYDVHPAPPPPSGYGESLFSSPYDISREKPDCSGASSVCSSGFRSPPAPPPSAVMEPRSVSAGGTREWLITV